jgi:hypothetical protein
MVYQIGEIKTSVGGIFLHSNADSVRALVARQQIVEIKEAVGPRHEVLKPPAQRRL